MKKLVSLVLLVCLLIPAAIAESPVDVKNLSDAELKALYKDVKAELMERKLWDAAILPAGVYCAGKNMPEGYYELTLNDGEIVSAWRSYEDYLSNASPVIYTYLSSGSKLTMSLVDGMCWYIPCDSVILPFTGFSW